MKITGYTGMNNVQRPTRLKMPDRDDPRIECSAIVNYDIGDTSELVPRKGGAIVNTGTPRNLWSNGDLCLFTEGGALKRLWPDWSDTVLRTGVTGRMAYQPVNNIVVYTDNTVIGAIVDGRDTPFPVSTVPFKLPIPAGQCLGFYNRRLYIAVGSILYFTDAGVNIGRMDERLCKIPLPGYITMVRPNENGMFVGYGNMVAYLAGSGPNKFTHTVVDRNRVVIGSDQTVDAQLVDGRIQAPTVAVWTSDDGIMCGMPDGQVTNMTKGTINLGTVPAAGASLFRQGTMNQYLISM
jgi:hypothetical protein